MPLHYVQHNYCGPFTTDFSAEAVNELDECCRTHDLRYDNPYIHTRNADSELVDCLQQTGTLSGSLIGGIIQIKQAIDVATNYASDVMLRPGNKRRHELKQQDAANKRSKDDENRRGGGNIDNNNNDNNQQDIEMDAGEPAVGPSDIIGGTVSGGGHNSNWRRYSRDTNSTLHTYIRTLHNKQQRNMVTIRLQTGRHRRTRKTNNETQLSRNTIPIPQLLNDKSRNGDTPTTMHIMESSKRRIQSYKHDSNNRRNTGGGRRGTNGLPNKYTTVPSSLHGHKIQLLHAQYTHPTETTKQKHDNKHTTNKTRRLPTTSRRHKTSRQTLVQQSNRTESNG